MSSSSSSNRSLVLSSLVFLLIISFSLVFWFSSSTTTKTQIVFPSQRTDERDISALPLVEVDATTTTTASPMETTQIAQTSSSASERYLFPDLKTLQQTVKMIQENKQPKFKQVQFDDSKLCRLRKYKLVLHHHHQRRYTEEDEQENADLKNVFLNCSSVSGRTYDEEENIEIFEFANKKKNKMDKIAVTPPPPHHEQPPLPLVKLLRSKKKRPRSFRYEQTAVNDKCAVRFSAPSLTPADAEKDPLRSAVWFREDQSLWLPAEEQHRLHALGRLRLEEERQRQAGVEARLQANLEAKYGTPAPPPPASSESLVLLAPRRMSGRQRYMQHLAKQEARAAELRRYQAVHQRKKRHKVVALLLTGEMRKLHQTSVAQKAKWIDANNNLNFMGMNNNVDVFVATWPTPLDEGPMQYFNNVQKKREERRRRLKNGEDMLLHDAEMYEMMMGNKTNSTSDQESNSKKKKNSKNINNDDTIDLFAGLDVAKQQDNNNNNKNANDSNAENDEDGEGAGEKQLKRKTAASLFDKTRPLSSTLTGSDMAALSNQLSYVVDALTKAFGGDRRQIAAVRVDSYNPQRMFLRSKRAFGTTLLRQGNSAPMLYLIEAVARLATVQYLASDYDFYIRSRFDLMPIDTLRLYPLKHTLQEEGFWYLEAGESLEGYMRFRSQSSDRGQLRSAQERGHRMVANNNAEHRGGGGHGVPWKGRLLKLPGSVQMVVHQTTMCCMNDWLWVGRFSSLLETSSVYSWASLRSLIKPPPLNRKKNSSSSLSDNDADDFDLVTDPGGTLIYPPSAAPFSKSSLTKMDMEDDSVTSSPTARYNATVCQNEYSRLNQKLLERERDAYGYDEDKDYNNDPDLRTRREGCYAETCIASALTASNIQWAVANLRVHLGHGSTGMGIDDVKNMKPRNVGSNCETKKCNYY